MPKRRTTPRKPVTPRGRRNRVTSLATIVPLALGLASTQLPSGQHVTQAATANTTAAATAFNTSCTLPFRGVLNPAIDDKCSIEGGSSDPAKQLESESKNDFCATTDSPEVYNHQQL